MLVSTGCVLGPLICAVGPAGRGAMVVVQPCARDRAPRGPAYFIGPIDDDGDAALLGAWLERGDSDVTILPERIRAQRDWISKSIRVN